MRHDAKASSAGSNSGQGSSLGSLRRAFATRGASSDVDGSSASADRRPSLLALVIVLLVALAFGASPAGATKIKKFDVGTAASGTTGGLFSSPRGIAVNRTGNGGVAAGTVYVVDFNNNRIQALTANGVFLRAWGRNASISSTTGDNSADPGFAYEQCVGAADCQGGTSTAAAGGFTGVKGGMFTSIAGGIAVNQTTGDVYIVDRNNFRIQQFTANGAFIRAWGQDVDTGGGTGFEVCEVAADCKAGVAGTGAGMFGSSSGIVGIGIDAAGNVYVADAANRRVQKFTASGGFLAMGGWDVVVDGSASDPGGVQTYQVCTVAADCKAGAASGAGAGQFTNNAPSFLAVDDSGNVYAVDSTNARIYHFTSALAFDASFTVVPGTGSLRAIAVNAVDGHLFVAKQTGDSNIYEIDPATQAIVDTHPGETSNWVGLAVNPVSGRMYAASGEAVNPGHIVRVFDDAPVPTPAIAPATNNTGTKATLNGTVDPNEVEVTSCFFEYGKTLTYGQTAPCAESAATIGTGSAPVPVHADISGLAPNATTYNFRLVAANSFGQVKSANESFPTANTVITTAASSVANTSATLNGTVNPDGVAFTDCHFEYVTQAAFSETGFANLGSGGSAPCNPAFGSIPVDSSTHAVSAGVTDLQPGVAYRFRLVAANANGAINGQDLTFSTGSPPQIETVGSPLRTTTTAQLNGRVNPAGAATTYHFEYGTTDSYGQSTPTRSAGSGSFTQLVAEGISGLEPSTTYHYRLVADNGNFAGPALGEDMTLTTRASEASLSHGHFPGPPGSDRAYEQVSVPDSGGNPVGSVDRFAPDGGRAIYAINGGTPTSSTGSLVGFNFAERTATGWQTKALTPPRSLLLGKNWESASSAPDLSSMTLGNYPGDNQNTLPERAYWRVSPEAPPIKLYETGPLQIRAGTNLFATESTRGILHMRGGELDPDYPGATSVLQGYEISSGSPELVSLLPDGNPPACGVPLNGVFSLPVASLEPLSPDGSRYFFTTSGNSCSAAPELYLRYLDTEETKLVSGPALSGPSCGGVLLRANAEAAFFWTQTRLAATDTAAPSCLGSSPPDGDVYRYDLESEELKCVTCVAPGIDADVYVQVGNGGGAAAQALAVAENGARVYFQSSHSLLPGVPPSSPAGFGGNVYVVEVETGELRWVAGPGVRFGQTGADAMTQDGAVIGFRADASSLNPLGDGGDNGGTDQYYRYDDRDRSLVCVSCPLDGSAPTAAAPSQDARKAFSENGRQFIFASPTSLVGADQNTAGPGQPPQSGTDVYEWRDGRLFLVSDGLISWPDGGPQVVGITPDGRDVFFTAATQYTPDALDGYRRLYDARVGGGFDFPKPPIPCPLEVCQGTPKGAPVEPPAGTGSFTGAGNVKTAPGKRACPKGKRKVRRHGRTRCVKRQQRTNHNRRAAR